MGTVTSQGLATKLRDLGLLVEWQRACAEFKCPNTEVPTEEQLAALVWWCGNMFAGPRPEDSIQETIPHWHELATAFSEASDMQGLNLQQYIKKPSLEFVRHVAGFLMAGKAASSPN